MKKLWKIEWNSIPLDRKIELGFIFTGIVVAIIVMINGSNQLEQMATQTTAMQGQLDEMITGREDTKDLVKASKSQAEETKKLALAMQDSLAIAKDTEKRQLRAYVVIGRMDLHRFGVGNIPQIQGIIENIGQTPAHGAGWESGINIFEYKANPTFTYDRCSVIRRLPEYPQWAFGKTSPVDKERPTAFTVDEIKRVQDGRAAIYFHGRLCYLDIFEEEHFTDFCIYWKWESGRLGIGIHCPKSEKST
jgi:hypothetical protein